LPLGRGVLAALVVENVGGLQEDEAIRWLAALVPCLRPGGRLIAADATSSTAAAARVAGAFLSSALTEIAQEWPRDGALLTIGVAPAPSVLTARFPAAAPGGGSVPGQPGTASDIGGIGDIGDVGDVG